MTLTRAVSLSDQQVPNRTLRGILSTARPQTLLFDHQRVPPLPCFQSSTISPTSPSSIYLELLMGEANQAFSDFSMYPSQSGMKVDYANANVTVKRELEDHCDYQSHMPCTSGHQTPVCSTPQTISQNGSSDTTAISDHSVSFTELDQLLNCDMTFYEELQLSGLVKQEPLESPPAPINESDDRMDYDDSDHDSESDCSDVICSESFNEVQSEIVRQVKNDIRLASTVLDLPADPRSWTVENVQNWIVWTLKHYNQEVGNLQDFKMNGTELLGLGENDFKRRSPHGATLYAQLDMWQNASSLSDEPEQRSPKVEQATTPTDIPSVLYPSSTDSGTVFQPLSPTQATIPVPPSVANDSQDNPLSPNPLSPTDSSVGDSTGFGSVSSCGSEDESEPCGRQTIHLWQFLKTLLLQPQFYGNCIRWLDRKNGIFKIEDSARVAKLWGKRKNRPAMNYDKLSRSIRQYYKKGIIKKTENSKRLVYRFCHPYLL